MTDDDTQIERKIDTLRRKSDAATKAYNACAGTCMPRDAQEAAYLRAWRANHRLELFTARRANWLAGVPYFPTGGNRTADEARRNGS